MTPRILIVAGSDSGGGAGIQADVKTVTMLGGHAMTAITAITAQNTLGVQAVHPVPTAMVVAQMRSCLDDIGVDAIKIGMIGSAETAHAVAEVLEGLRETGSNILHPGLEPGSRFLGASRASGTPDQVRGDESVATIAFPIVFDPVMVATSGAILADAETIAAFERLMRIATVVTPNVAELEALSGVVARTEYEAENAARSLVDRYGSAILAKGGHRAPEGGLLSDVLVQPVDHPIYWTGGRIETRHSHGTGCTMASAIAVGLGAGMTLDDAVGQAHRYVRAALLAAPGLGQGHGPMGHALGMVPFNELEG